MMVDEEIAPARIQEIENQHRHVLSRKTLLHLAYDIAPRAGQALLPFTRPHRALNVPVIGPGLPIDQWIQSIERLSENRGLFVELIDHAFHHRIHFAAHFAVYALAFVSRITEFRELIEHLHGRVRATRLGLQEVGILGSQLVQR